MLASFLILFQFFMAHGDSLAKDSFAEGVRLFQEQRFVDAMVKFEDAHSKEPDNPYTLFNWGLAAYTTEKRGLALGLWRRALYADPEFSQARAALKYAQDHMPRESFSTGEGLLQNLKMGLLRELSFNKIILVNILLLAFAGWLSLRYFGQRRQALEDDLPLPRIPTLAVFFVILFFFSGGLGLLKFFSHHEIYATVIESNMALKTAPSPDSNTIYTLIEGSEVIVETTENDWTLVTYPGGMTGWVPKTSIFISAGATK